MIVEDSAIAARKLAAMLDSMGHSTVIAANGAEAVEAYGRHRPDVVAMDIHMPGMGGVEATRRILESHPEAAIVMVTSQGHERMVIDAVAAGARGYVLKPVRPERLAAMLDKVTSGRRG
ncbi:MAG: response regulator [Actinomycetota bacterium]